MIDVTQDGNDPEFKRGVALLQQGDVDEAKVFFQTLLKQRPKSDAIRTTLAAIAIEQSAMTEAVEYCSNVLREIPEHPIAREILAEANIRMAEAWKPGEDIAPLADAIEDALTLAPDLSGHRTRSAKVLRGFTEHLKRTGRDEEALRYAQKAESLAG